MTIASDIRDILTTHGMLEYVSMKVASEEATYQAQLGVAKIANEVTEYLYRESKGDILGLVEKFAAENNRALTPDDKVKIAAALTVDEALTKAASADLTVDTRNELVATRTYGREVLAEILRGVL